MAQTKKAKTQKKAQGAGLPASHPCSQGLSSFEKTNKPIYLLVETNNGPEQISASRLRIGDGKDGNNCKNTSQKHLNLQNIFKICHFTAETKDFYEFYRIKLGVASNLVQNLQKIFKLKDKTNITNNKMYTIWDKIRHFTAETDGFYEFYRIKLGVVFNLVQNFSKI